MYKYKNPNAPATRSQLWALYLASGRRIDYRGKGLTIAKAGNLLSELNANRNRGPKSKGTDWLPILEAASKAAEEAKANFVAEHYKAPAFAIVQRENPFDDTSRVTRVCGVMNDVCGYVWIELPLKGNQSLIKWFKGGKHTNQFGDKEWRIDSRMGSFALSYSKYRSAWGYPWHLTVPNIGYGNGSMGAEEAAGSAFVKHMNQHGCELSLRSRID